MLVHNENDVGRSIEMISTTMTTNRKTTMIKDIEKWTVIISARHATLVQPRAKETRNSTMAENSEKLESKCTVTMNGEPHELERSTKTGKEPNIGTLFIDIDGIDWVITFEGLAMEKGGSGEYKRTNRAVKTEGDEEKILKDIAMQANTAHTVQSGYCGPPRAKNVRKKLRGILKTAYLAKC